MTGKTYTATVTYLRSGGLLSSTSTIDNATTAEIRDLDGFFLIPTATGNFRANKLEVRSVAFVENQTTTA